MFFRRSRPRPGPVRLLTPPHRATTEPLQRHYWQTDAEFEEATSSTVGALAWSAPQIVDRDRSQPRSVAFSWLPPAGVRERVSYDLLLSTAADLSEPLVVRGLSEPMVRVRHLLIDTVYHWRVIAMVGGVLVSESPIWAFRTHPATPRWIRVPDLTNVRDLGGWRIGADARVRQGRLYRSSELNSHLVLTPEGEATLLRELRLRTDLDLRAPGENPAPALPQEWVQWVNVPLEPYELITSPSSREGLVRIFELLAREESYPLVFHCWAGVDRAGTLAFLVNAVLGVDYDSLVRDYELSTLSVWGERSRSAPEFVRLVRSLEEHGGGAATIGGQAERFLLDSGVLPEHIAAVRRLLIEPVRDPDWGRFSESY